MSIAKKIGDTIGDKIGELTVGKVVALIAGGLSASLLAAWAYVWMHVNPQFDYVAKPSSSASHFVGLAEILHKIDTDSRQYCSGGLDERLGRIGLRRCYRFTFVPGLLYKMYVCTHDELPIEAHTSDQLVALRAFEGKFASLQCFSVVPQQSVGAYDYDIVQGKGVSFHLLRFPNAAPEKTPFCGCSPSDVKGIANTIDAKLEN